MVKNGKKYEKKWTRGTSLYIPPPFSLQRPHYLSLHGRNQGIRKICNAPSRSRTSSFLGVERCQFDPFIAPIFLTRLRLPLFECLKQKKRKKEGHPCLMLQTSTIKYTITKLLCWSYCWNWIKSDSYLTVVNILVYLDSWTRWVFVCSRTGKWVLHLTSPFTHLKTRLLL